uniref:Uncharacterized protein n=1 Tax=Rhizophora mucronata TaxID=61149 RepID=A0A2P2JMS5_RHIMU
MSYRKSARNRHQTQSSASKILLVSFKVFRLVGTLHGESMIYQFCEQRKFN